MSAPAPFRLLAAVVRALLLTVRGVFAAGVAAFLLAGLPYGLIHYIGWPLPHQVPSLPQLTTDLTSPILGDQVYLNAIAIAIWLLWLLITVSFTAETIAVLRGVEIPPLPGLRPTQALAVILLTAIGITALMAHTAAPAQAAATPAQIPARAPAATAPVRPGTTLTNETAITTATTDGAATGPSLTHPAETLHTVRTGENLYEIARTDYGNGDDWTALYTDNAGLPQADGQKLTNPDLIRPGWILHTTNPATTPPASTSAPAPNSAAPAPSRASTPHETAPTQAPTVAAPAAPAPARPAAPTAPEQQRTSRAPTAQSTTGSPAPTPARHPAPSASPDWIDLAEGGALAAGVLAALGLALRRARRLRRWYGTCYWPTPGQHPSEPLTVPVPLRPAIRRTTATDPGGDVELDEFGAPIDPAGDAVPTVNAGPEEAAKEYRPQHSAQIPHPEPEPSKEADEPGPARIAVAQTDGRILSLQDLDSALTLTGSGALPAARAVAAAVLSASWHRHDGARLIISRQDAALLLERTEGNLPTWLGIVPDLELAANSTDALAQLEQYVTYRARLLEELEVSALEDTPDYDDDYFPPVVLIAVARPDHAARITATLQAGQGLRTHAILLGEHPAAPTWHVETDGHLTGPGAPTGTRMFHLSATALAEALALLQDATGDTLREIGPPIAPDPHAELAAPDPDPQSSLGDDAPSQPALNAHMNTTIDAEPEPEIVGGKAEPEAAEPDLPEPASDADVASTAVLGTDQAVEQHSTPGDRRFTEAPLLVAADTGPDQVAQIIAEHAARPVRIKVLGVRAIATPTGTVDARLRADSWRTAMKLAVAGRHGQHHDDLAVLWPDQDDQALRKTVKNAVYDLRKTLKQRCADPANHPGRYIAQANHRYMLNDQTVGVDLAAFTALRTLAAQTRDPAERAAAAEAALTYYDGDLLTGEEEEWMIAPRTKLRRDALATATLLAQLSDQAGDPQAAMNWWERALQIDDNEEVYRQIITAQLRLGRHADALATRDLLMVRLDTDDLAPAAATMDVLARLHNRRPKPGDTRSTQRRAA